MRKIRKLAAILLIFIILVTTYFHAFHYVDLETGCSIVIKPSLIEFSNRNIIKALKILKYAAPEDYQTVCKNINSINPNIACGGWHGGCYYHKQGEIYVSAGRWDFLGATSAIIVHETCHDIQHKENRPLDEKECYQADHKILQEIVRF